MREFEKEYKNTNYQIVFYNGYRRLHHNFKGELFCKKHIEYINNYIPNIGLVSFIINKSDESLDKEVVDFINNSDIKFNYEIILRDNIGFSYGAWAETIEKNHTKFDYTFIIEDDYIPVEENTLDYFYKKIDDETIYVCCLYVNGHASISNGMINTKIMRGNNINILESYVGKDYSKGTYNQSRFMTEYKKYKFKDITDVAYTTFQSFVANKTIPYGDKTKKLIIKPILG